MAIPSLARLWLMGALCFSPPGDLGELDLEGADWAEDPWAEEATPAYQLKGHWLPSLVRLAEEDPHIEVPFTTGQPIYEGSFELRVDTRVRHPFEGEVEEVTIEFTLIDPTTTADTWYRLTAPPLELSDAQVDEPFPHPLLERRWTVDGDEVHEEVEEMAIDSRALPEYLATVADYRLRNPSVSDLRAIVKHGGAADFAALVGWARTLTQTELESGLEPSVDSGPGAEAPNLVITPTDRQALLELVVDQLRRLRAPPALGDLQRIQGLLVLLRVLAEPGDLELLLSMERPMHILLTSAGLSYHDVLRVEHQLEIPLDGMGRMPTLADFMDGYQLALEDIRVGALPMLLRLSFDPLDFRDATHAHSFEVSPVQKQALQLLAPLDPRKVPVMLAAGESTEAQRSILEFYIDIGHPSVGEPLIDWLADHPDQVETVGSKASAQIGPILVPVLLRYYLDRSWPRDLARHKLSRRLLLDLTQPEASDQVVSAIASTGVAVDEDTTVAIAVERYEAEERARLRGHAGELERSTFSDPNPAHALESLVLLGEIAPDRVEARADEVLVLLEEIALALDADSPKLSDRAIELHATLPFGPHSEHALDHQAIVQARRSVGRGDHAGALEILLERDEELDAEALRHAYESHLVWWIDLSIEVGDYANAHRLLDEAEHRLDARFEGKRRSLFWAQYWPAVVLGSLFGLTLTTTATWLVVSAVRKSRSAWEEELEREDRYVKRGEHAKRTKDERETLERSLVDVEPVQAPDEVGAANTVLLAPGDDATRRIDAAADLPGPLASESTAARTG